MDADLARVVGQLNRRFLRDHPRVAARRLEEQPLPDALDEISELPAAMLIPVWPYLAGDRGGDLLSRMSPTVASDLLAGLRPTEAARFLGALDEEDADRLLEALPADHREPLRALMTWPDDTAGRLMDTRVLTFRPRLTAGQALEQLRQARLRAPRALFVVDDDNRLTGHVPIQELAIARPDAELGELAHPVAAAVNPMDPRDEVVNTVEQNRLTELPVLDLDGRLMGLILPESLVQALQEEAAADIGSMVGVSPAERALSSPWFAVRKRLPWLIINVFTAFMAASVVGMFEDTIAKFTALAVLVPIVAGQAGNTGAQAQAVTMRGLALREITVRQWFSLVGKEVIAGMVNGIAVAATVGVCVYVWSHSAGLVLVIMSAMVLAMTAASFAGAAVPLLLTRLGQDPAQSSSIVLTTITDISGFFSFLGIATLLSRML